MVKWINKNWKGEWILKYPRFLILLLLFRCLHADPESLPKLGLYGGGSLGVASNFNLTMGASYKRKVYAEISPGIWSYSGFGGVKNFGSVYYQSKLMSYGMGCLFVIDRSKDIVNPGILISLDPFKFAIKMSLDLFVGVPITSLKLENSLNLRVKTVLLDW